MRLSSCRLPLTLQSIFRRCYSRCSRSGRDGLDWGRTEERRGVLLNRAVPIPGNALVSFDISWFDPSPNLNKYYLADRSNKSVDVISPPANSTSFPQKFTPGFVGARSTCGDN